MYEMWVLIIRSFWRIWRSPLIFAHHMKSWRRLVVSWDWHSMIIKIQLKKYSWVKSLENFQALIEESFHFRAAWNVFAHLMELNGFAHKKMTHRRLSVKKPKRARPMRHSWDTVTFVNVTQLAALHDVLKKIVIRTQGWSDQMMEIAVMSEVCGRMDAVHVNAWKVVLCHAFSRIALQVLTLAIVSELTMAI